MWSCVRVLCCKMGAFALHSALNARLETKKKNLPDAPSCDAETLPLWCDFVVGELALVSVAVAFFGVLGPS